MKVHEEISVERGRDSLQTGQYNPLFHRFADLVHRIVAWQIIDWLVPDSQFSPDD